MGMRKLHNRVQSPPRRAVRRTGQTLARLSRPTKIPPDDIGNRNTELDHKTSAPDNVGNSTERDPTHLLSGVLQFLQTEWLRSSSPRARAAAAKQGAMLKAQTRAVTAARSPNGQALTPVDAFPVASRSMKRRVLPQHNASPRHANPPVRRPTSLLSPQELEALRDRTQKLVQETVALCGIAAEVEALALQSGDRSAVLVLVDEEDHVQKSEKRLFLRGHVALTALNTLTDAVLNPARGCAISLVVLPRVDKKLYLQSFYMKTEGSGQLPTYTTRSNRKAKKGMSGHFPSSNQVI
ncbi:MAG: hypothetical protein AAF471_03345 [Myxococcota bacterium]